MGEERGGGSYRREESRVEMRRGFGASRGVTEFVRRKSEVGGVSVAVRGSAGGGVKLGKRLLRKLGGGENGE